MPDSSPMPSTSAPVAEAVEPSNDPDSWSYVEPKAEPKEAKEPKAEAKAEPKEAKAPPKERRIEKIKVNGQEEAVDVEEALRAYAKNKSADQSLREIAEEKKRMSKFIETLQKDPEKILGSKNIPISKEARRNLAEKWLTEALSEEMQDPRDVALAQRDAKLKEYQDREDAEEQEYQEQQRSEQVAQRKEALSKVFSEAMKESPLSQDPRHAVEVMRDMAMYYRIARQNGENPSPAEVAAHVENSTLSRFHKVAQTLTGEQLIKLLGPEVLKAIRQSDLESLRNGRSQQQQKPNNDSWNKPSRQAEEKKHMTPAEAKEAVRKKLGL